MLNHRRLWTGGAVTASLIATTMLLGTPGQAQDKTEPKEQRRVTIIERHTSDHGGHKPGERREFHLRRGENGDVVYRGIDPEMRARIESCREGHNSLLNVDEGQGQERTRIVLCTKGDGAAANTVEALQRAREQIAKELSGSMRDRVLAQLDAEIAKARARN